MSPPHQHIACAVSVSFLCERRRWPLCKIPDAACLAVVPRFAWLTPDLYSCLSPEIKVAHSSPHLSPPLLQMFSQTKQQTSQLWMWRMEYLHHEQRPLYFGEWF